MIVINNKPDEGRYNSIILKRNKADDSKIHKKPNEDRYNNTSIV